MSVIRLHFVLESASHSCPPCVLRKTTAADKEATGASGFNPEARKAKALNPPDPRSGQGG